MYIAAHEELIAEYIEAHPDADWSEAYDKCADGAWNRMTDKIAAVVDSARDMMKDRGLA